MGKAGVQRRGVERAVPPPAALGLVRPEAAPRRVAVPVVELVGGQARPRRLSLTKNAEIVMSYQSGSSETGSLYLVPKPQKIDIPIGVYVNTEIDANRAVSLDFHWLQSDTFIIQELLTYVYEDFVYLKH